MLVLPAIDLLGGKCVRLSQGDYNREKVYGEDPVALAKLFEDEGAEWLHVVDLDGAKTGLPSNLHWIEKIASQTGLKVEFGGGIRSLEVAKSSLNAGVQRVVVGTKLVQDPELAALLFRELGEGVVAGIDAREGKAAVAGWLDQSEVTAVELAQQMVAGGAKRFIVTDIARDGMLTGPNTQLLLDVQRAVPVPVIQSGGIAELSDLEALLALGDECPEGVIVGRAIYEGKFSVKDAVSLLKN